MTMFETPLCDEIITGYHGTSIEKAEIILGTQEFQKSNNSHDWLGSGIYFWKNDKQRAWFWADGLFKNNSVVIEVKIKLGICLSFLSASAYNLLRIAHQNFLLNHDSSLIPQNIGKKHDLDCAIINHAIKEYAPNIQTVEAFYKEGEPIYKDSSFCHLDSIQVSVIDETCFVSEIKISKR